MVNKVQSSISSRW